jgi:hypothetical protein
MYLLSVLAEGTTGFGRPPPATQSTSIARDKRFVESFADQD